MLSNNGKSDQKKNEEIKLQRGTLSVPTVSGRALRISFVLRGEGAEFLLGWMLEAKALPTPGSFGGQKRCR